MKIRNHTAMRWAAVPIAAIVAASTATVMVMAHDRAAPTGSQPASQLIQRADASATPSTTDTASAAPMAPHAASAAPTGASGQVTPIPQAALPQCDGNTRDYRCTNDLNTPPPWYCHGQTGINETPYPGTLTCPTPQPSQGQTTQAPGSSPTPTTAPTPAPSTPTPTPTPNPDAYAGQGYFQSTQQGATYGDYCWRNADSTISCYSAPPTQGTTPTTGAGAPPPTEADSDWPMVWQQQQQNPRGPYTCGQPDNVQGSTSQSYASGQCTPTREDSDSGTPYQPTCQQNPGGPCEWRMYHWTATCFQGCDGVAYQSETRPGWWPTDDYWNA